MQMERTTVLPTLTVYRFRLLLALGEGRHALPAYLGSTLRGVVAGSFRSIVCATGAPTCDGCLLLNRCAYPYIFETPPPAHLPEALQKRFRQAPRPYILAVPMTHAGEAVLELGLVLVGRGLDYLPYFLYVLQETGRRGLGRARVPYRLLTVSDASTPNGAVIYRADEGILQETIQPVTLADVQEPDDAQVTQTTLTCLTPLRIKKYGTYQEAGERMTFRTVMDLLLGRLEALAMFHCGTAWAPQKALREAADHVHVTARHLTLERLERYSNRHRQTLPMHGLLGSISFAGHLAPFLPFLRMGQYVHIGAGTAFGLGHYHVHTSRA